MHLWTDYEGKTIAGAYPVGKLLRSEGRNAFFATRNPQGTSAVLRLTEAHFDESEMMKRWSKVAQLHQSTLLEIEKFGETTVDGVVLAYALLEPNDANLDEVLKERPLTCAEALQIARSVGGALAALHAGGLVHEHVEPANVLAVGEDVKLRSDCVRECVADMEFSSAEECAELRRRDVHDFGSLLLRCLTLERVWAPVIKLPEPFHQIVPNALDGSWTLTQIMAALERNAAATAKRTAKDAPLVPQHALAASPAPAKGTTAAQDNLKSLPEEQIAAEEAPRLRPRTYVPPVQHSTVRPRSVVALALAAAVILFLGWFFIFRSPAAPSAAPTPASMAAATAPAVDRPVAPTAQIAQPVAPAVRGGWRVIAYTYDHEAPAQAQLARLAKKHPRLHAEIFSPKGRAPYLIALSGPVSQDEAKTILRQARRDGLPRDTFIRNY